MRNYGIENHGQETHFFVAVETFTAGVKLVKWETELLHEHGMNLLNHR